MKLLLNLKIIGIFLIFIFGVSSVSAQYYIIGQDPGNIKWNQINSENFNVIFPENYEDQAMEYVNLLEYSRLAISKPYIKNTKKFKIVLHNRTTTSNAMVSPTPFHADFFEMPDQNSYSQLWNRQLTLHEYRHAVQIQKMKQGFTKGLYYVLGEQAPAAIMGIFLPFWFIEGDAVFSETINSRSGRGRSPSFSMDLKAQILDKKVYSYDKAISGSYKNYTPDYYTLGYQLVLNGHSKYGYDIWNDALNKIARKPFTIMPFSSTIKKYHGKGKVDFYKSSMDELKIKWENEDVGKSSNFISQPNSKHFTNYKFPVQINDTTIIALKTSIDDVQRFVKIDKKGNEEILFTPGFLFEESLSANDSLICWNEKSYDPRWGLQNYSVIKIHNFKTSKTEILTRKSRYFSPQLSKNAKMLCAVEVDEKNKSQILIIDTKTKEIKRRFYTKEDLFFTSPQWNENDKQIISIAVGKQGKAIVAFDVEGGEMEILMDFTFLDIKFASLNKEKLIFTAPFNQTNNIYLKNISTNETFKLTNTRFDAANIRFSAKADRIYFSEYTADGYRISEVSSLKEKDKLVEFKNLNGNFAIDDLAKKSDFVLDDSIVPNNKYDVKKYSKAAHLFNFHSWAPVGIDIDNYSVTPGATLLSQNLLSSSIASLGYYYNLNEETGSLKFNYDYYGWYPVVKFEVEYAGRRVYQFNDTTNQYDEIRFFETNISTGFSLPLNFTTNKWIKGIQPYVGVSQKFRKMHRDSKYNFVTNQFTSLTYQFYAYNQLKTSLRDIFPKWGQSINLAFRNTPFGGDLNQQFYSSANIYLPGIIQHHGIKLYGAYQKTELSNYPYSNIINIARGYNNINFKEMYSFKSDYALPLIYPDLNIPSILYLKRIHGRAFYDLMFNGNTWDKFSSAGAEIYSDWHFLGLPAIVTLGGRFSYKIENSSTEFEFLFGLGY